jgi:hypothetical protein
MDQILILSTLLLVFQFLPQKLVLQSTEGLLLMTLEMMIGLVVLISLGVKPLRKRRVDA